MQVPVIDLKLLNSDLKTRDALKSAAMDVGYAYLVGWVVLHCPLARFQPTTRSRHGLPDDLLLQISQITRTIFAIPAASKRACDILNSPHFFGYNPFGTVSIQGRPDLREHFDFGDDEESRWVEGDPLWERVRPGD